MILVVKRKSKYNILIICVNRSKDYFSGAIIKDGVKISEFRGNYMGYLDFDGVRYWDLRDQFKYDVIALDIDQALKSDSRNRIDSKALLAGEVE